MGPEHGVLHSKQRAQDGHCLSLCSPSPIAGRTGDGWIVDVVAEVWLRWRGGTNAARDTLAVQVKRDTSSSE